MTFVPFYYNAKSKGRQYILILIIFQTVTHVKKVWRALNTMSIRKKVRFGKTILMTFWCNLITQTNKKIKSYK